MLELLHPYLQRLQLGLQLFIRLFCLLKLVLQRSERIRIAGEHRSSAEGRRVQVPTSTHTGLFPIVSRHEKVADQDANTQQTGDEQKISQHDSNVDLHSARCRRQTCLALYAKQDNGTALSSLPGWDYRLGRSG